MSRRIKAFARKNWDPCLGCGSTTKHKKNCPRGKKLNETEEIMKDKKLYKAILDARKKGSKTSPYKPLVSGLDSLKQQLENQAVELVDAIVNGKEYSTDYVKLSDVLKAIGDLEKSLKELHSLIRNTKWSTIKNVEHDRQIIDMIFKDFFPELFEEDKEN